uniref:Uncharacterized protein n=1 Tax=Arundo donax TaxID=35708 RepID=A0A0A8ZN29_ARUDO
MPLLALGRRRWQGRKVAAGASMGGGYGNLRWREGKWRGGAHREEGE